MRSSRSPYCAGLILIVGYQPSAKRPVRPSIFGAWAATQTAGGLPPWSGVAKSARSRRQNDPSNDTGSPRLSQSRRMMVSASSRRLTRLVNGMPYGAVFSRSPLPMPRIARPPVR